MSTSVAASSSKRTIEGVLNTNKLGRSRIISFAILFMVIAVDGADVAASSMIYPSLIEEWGVSDQMITIIVTVSLIFMAIGAMVAGPLADRHGRKRILTLTLLIVVAGTYLTAVSLNAEVFLVMRSVAMLGLGAAMPISVALASEIAPTARRSFLVAVVFAGYTAGVAAAGFSAAKLIPPIGWSLYMALLATVAAVAFLLVIAFVSESFQHLASRPGNEQRVIRALQRIDTNVHANNVDLAPASNAAKAEPGGIAAVLSRRYLAISISIWLCYFVGIMVVYLFLTYFPLIVTRSGLTIEEAGFLVTVNGLVGIAGSIVLGLLMDKIGRVPTLIGAWSLVIISFWLVGPIEPAYTGLLLFTIFWGFLIAPTNTGINALAATSYPSGARATGVAWMHSVGRVGSILMGVVGGTFLTLGWSVGTIFTVMSIPLAVGVVALFILGRALRREAKMRGSEVEEVKVLGRSAS